MIGGIDLGGTKIEARVFDDTLQEIARHRIPTPIASYDGLLDGLAVQIAWIESQGEIAAIGLGSPGLINPHTGEMLTANLPATGQRLAKDISARAGRDIAVINDCRAFTLSEALLGAGASHRNVVGLVIGTGVAGGHVVDQHLVPDLNGQHGEYGHLPLPADIVAQHRLPLHACGCGLTACYETYLSGPGLVRLATHLTDQTLTTHEILNHHPDVRDVWMSLAATLIGLISRTSDPDVIVLGGGLGTVPGLAEDLTALIPDYLLANTTPPQIVRAMHGDASGALGAAFYARQKSEGV